jgi:hypothetical protein
MWWAFKKCLKTALFYLLEKRPQVWLQGKVFFIKKTLHFKVDDDEMIIAYKRKYSGSLSIYF